MYVLDKILYVILYMLSRSLKLLFFVIIISLIIGLAVLIVSAISFGFGGVFVFSAFIPAMMALGTLLYTIFWLAHDGVEVILLRMDPLHPKPLFDDIMERIPILNAIFKGFQATKNPFESMRMYSY